MRPTVLCFSGLDPSGGAGLQADIESIGASQAHAAIACTAITIQSSQRVFGFEACDPELVRKQALAVLDDLPVQAIKSGMLGDIQTLHMLKDLFAQGLIPKNTPYVLDPVLVANSGDALGDADSLAKAFLMLMPYASLVTPNSHELRALTAETCLKEAAKKLCAQGAGAVLIKTAHDHPQADFMQYLYVDGKEADARLIKRLPGEYHGSGCSQASFLAGRLACGDDLFAAVELTDQWMQQILAQADQPHPNLPTAQSVPKRPLPAAFI